MYFKFDDENEGLHLIKRRNRSISSFTLRLTSMIDMFTILLVFLLKSFSVEGEIMSVSKDLHLPESTAETPPRATPMLVVTSDWVILDGNPIERVDTILSQNQNLIPALGAQLANIRQFSSSLAQLDESKVFQGTITIQGDREIPFALLKKIMFTCGKQGFNNMLLAVNKVEQS